MEHLPTELKEQVCEGLEGATLKSLRSVNKIWAKITTPVLFGNVCLTSSSLQGFVDLSEHQSLREYVKSVTFYPHQLPWILPETWHEASRSSPTALNVTIRESGAVYENYVAHWRRQQRFGYAENIDLIISAIQRFSNLHRMKVAGHTWYRRGIFVANASIEDESCVWRSLKTLALLRPAPIRDDEVELLVLTAMKILAIQKSAFITTFEGGIVPMSCWAYDRMHYPDTLQTAFRHLKVLHLGLLLSSRFIGSSCWSTRDRVGSLKICLDGAINLEELVLHLCYGPSAEAIMRYSEKLLGMRAILPRLKILGLEQVVATKTELCDFLQQYRHTLVSLTLHSIVLLFSEIGNNKDLWPPVLDALVLEDWNLNRVQLQSLAYETDETDGGIVDLDDQYLRSMEQAIVKHVTTVPACLVAKSIGGVSD